MLHSHYENSFGLIIGINEYRYAPPLSYACNDADVVASILTSELGFPASQVTLLKNGAATREAIVEAYLNFSSLAANLDDRLFVFFAGHGMTVEGMRGPIGYLVPVDGDTDKFHTLIRWDDLTRNAELIPAKHILFIIDACYSGLALPRAITPGTQRFLSDMLQRPARQVLTAGKKDETVADGGGATGKNSIFTGYLIEGLQGAAANPDGVLTANALMHYVYEKVGKDSRSQQTPHYGHIEGDGDFVLKVPNDGHLKPESEGDFLVNTFEEVPEVQPSQLPSLVTPTFALKSGYGDSSSATFGRNEWTGRLGERRHNGDSWTSEYTKAFSWFSLIVEPTSNQRTLIDIAKENERLSGRNQNPEEPYRKFAIPRQTRTSIDSLIFYSQQPNRDFWAQYLRITKTGNLEYADCGCVFWEHSGLRRFDYVEIIGLTWQFMFLAQDILTNAGYVGGVRLLVNLVGTRNSILEGFSKGEGEDKRKWSSPEDGSYRTDLLGLSCPDSNLQIEYKMVIGTLDESHSFDVVKDLARQLGLAYNHMSSPRCFNYNTEIFPWGQYLNGINSCRNNFY
jgi:hypothetical protein